MTLVDPARRPGANPIDSHVAALAGALRGPRRVRRSMIAEARAGLWDAAEAYRAGGLAPAVAEAHAVRDFGGVPEIAPAFQEELAARRGRWSAAVFAVVFPGMLVGWDLVWWTGAGAGAGVTASASVSAGAAVPALARALDVVALLVAVAAVVMLVVTFRRTVPPRSVVRAVGVTGAVGAAACGGLAVTMNVVGGAATLAVVSTSPVVAVAFAVSAVVLGLTGWQSVRTLRVVSSAGRPRVPRRR